MLNNINKTKNIIPSKVSLKLLDTTKVLPQEIYKDTESLISHKSERIFYNPQKIKAGFFVLSGLFIIDAIRSLFKNFPNKDCLIFLFSQKSLLNFSQSIALSILKKLSEILIHKAIDKKKEIISKDLTDKEKIECKDAFRKAFIYISSLTRVICQDSNENNSKFSQNENKIYLKEDDELNAFHELGHVINNNGKLELSKKAGVCGEVLDLLSFDNVALILQIPEMYNECIASNTAKELSKTFFSKNSKQLQTKIERINNFEILSCLLPLFIYFLSLTGKFLKEFVFKK